MPESPDFEQIAREMGRGLIVLNVVADHDRAREAFERDLAEQLRQVWNARGAADDLVLQEAHARLDRAGVPKADGHRCDDPKCETKLGHRIKILLAERDELRRLLDDVPPGT